MTAPSIDLGPPAAAPGRGVSRFFDRHPKLRLSALLAAPVAWLVVLYLGALAALLLTSLYQLNETGDRIIHELSLTNFRDLLTEEVYRRVAFRTIFIAAAVTVIDVVLAVPFAFFLAKLAPKSWRALLVAGILVPLWASYLVKAFAWRAILGTPGGILESTTGRSPGYSQTGVIIVLAYLWLPYMVLPIYAGLERLPDSLLEASGDLGARFGATMRHVVVPTLRPAILAGSIFTFSLSMGDYIAVELVGGTTQMIGSVVYDNFATNLPFAAAFATVPIAIMVIYLVAVSRAGALEEL